MPYTYTDDATIWNNEVFQTKREAIQQACKEYEGDFFIAEVTEEDYEFQVISNMESRLRY